MSELDKLGKRKKRPTNNHELRKKYKANTEYGRQSLIEVLNENKTAKVYLLESVEGDVLTSMTVKVEVIF